MQLRVMHPVSRNCGIFATEIVAALYQSLTGLFLIKRHARLRARSTLYLYKEGLPGRPRLEAFCTRYWPGMALMSSARGSCGRCQPYMVVGGEVIPRRHAIHAAPGTSAVPPAITGLCAPGGQSATATGRIAGTP